MYHARGTHAIAARATRSDFTKSRFILLRAVRALRLYILLEELQGCFHMIALMRGSRVLVGFCFTKSKRLITSASARHHSAPLHMLHHPRLPPPRV